MLKRTVSLVALSLLFISCNDKGASKITDADMKVVDEEIALIGEFPKVELDKLVHDFGVINEGDVVETEFLVKNIGQTDLIIADAKGSCGCTVPQPPKEPIKPGGTAPIKVSFNSSGKPGQQSKTITLTTNTAAGQETFEIKATVTPKAK